MMEQPETFWTLRPWRQLGWRWKKTSLWLKKAMTPSHPSNTSSPIVELYPWWMSHSKEQFRDHFLNYFYFHQFSAALQLSCRLKCWTAKKNQRRKKTAVQCTVGTKRDHEASLRTRVWTNREVIKLSEDIASLAEPHVHSSFCCDWLRGQKNTSQVPYFFFFSFSWCACTLIWLTVLCVYVLIWQGQCTWQ